ncbi:MAG: allantoinase AllB [Candidatus Geothermarchaeales archaeon]
MPVTAVDLTVKNCRIVTPSAILDVGIAIDDGKIVAIAKDDRLPNSAKVINAEGNHVLPGAIDAHVHFRDPGYTYKEDFRSGSEAAAAGGVTTVLDMPNNRPLTSTDQLVAEKARMAGGKSLVDFGLYGCITRENLGDILGMAEAGVIGFKIYTGQTVGDIPPIDDEAFLRALTLVSQTNLRTGVHAEDEEIRLILEGELKSLGRRDIFAHIEARPNEVEEEGISKAITLAVEAGSRLHICHLSTAEGVELVRRGKAAGHPLTSETCPQYLLLKKKDLERHGLLAKVNPPIRGVQRDINALWRGLCDGAVEAIATDHAPHTMEEKMGGGSVWEAAAGIIGVETMVPLMLTQVNRGLLSLNRFAELTSEGPSRCFDLFPRKGAIRVGSDADLTIVDLKREGVIRSDRLRSKSSNTVFDGWRVKGAPILTMVRGKVVYEDGEVVGKPGFGEFLKPALCLGDATNP